MLIHCVTAENRASYSAQLDDMHRLRWRIYIEERGWAALKAKQALPGYERDEFDDERAHYLLALGDEGAVLGAMRLRPADDGSVLADHFPHLIEPDAAFAFGCDVWELSRLLRAPLCRSREGQVRYAMNCALIEFCLSRGIERLIAAADSYLLPMTRKAWGSKVRPIGLPQPYDEGEAIALELSPDEEALALMRWTGAVSTDQLYEHPTPAHAALDEDPIRAADLTQTIRERKRTALRAGELRVDAGAA